MTDVISISSLFVLKHTSDWLKQGLQSVTIFNLYLT